MAESLKRAADADVKPDTSPKRARTDPSTTSESVDVTQALFSAGAVTVESAIERSVAEQERERLSVRSGRVLGATLVDDEEGDGEDATIEVDPPSGESLVAALDDKPSSKPLIARPLTASTIAPSFIDVELADEEIDYSADPDDRNRECVLVARSS